MPGALDVLVEIQFSANDAVLKEINAQLEKESNILKTIEDRLKQLNAAASGQGAISAQLKLVNKEIEQTNRLLLRMQTSYKEVDYAGESLKKQKNNWADLALAMRQAPDASSKFKAVLFELISMLPQLTNNITAASRSGTGLAGVIGGMGKSVLSAGSMISLGAVAITLLADKMLEQSAAAKAADEANRRYLDSVKRINESTDASIIQETTKLDILYRTATNKDALPDARKAAAMTMKETWPVMFKNYSIWQIMENKATEAVQKTTEAIKARTTAEGDEQLLREAKDKRNKLLALEEERRKKINPTAEKDAKLLEDAEKNAGGDAIDKRAARLQVARIRQPQQEYDATKAQRIAADEAIAALEKKILINKGKGDPSRAVPTDNDHSYTPPPEKDRFLEEIEKLYEGYTKAKAKILAEDAALSKESLEQTVEAERKAAIESLNNMVAAKQKERQLTSEEAEEIEKTRVSINSKYNFQLLKELDDYNKRVRELNRSVHEVQSDNDKKALSLKKDDLNAKLAIIDIETNEQIRKANERFGALKETAKKLSQDTKDIEQEKSDAILAIQIEGQMKSIDAQLKYFDDQAKLIDLQTSTLLAETDSETQQALRKTKNPRNKAVLTTQSNMTKNQIEQGALSEKLNVAIQKRNKLREGGPGVTAEEVAESEANVAKIINQLERLKGSYEEMQTELTKQKVARVTGTISDVNDSIQKIGSGVDAFMEAEQAKTAGLISEQEKRVERAKEFAKNGNTAMLEAEQERLSALEKKHREYAEKRRAVNAILVASQQAVNIAEAIGAVISSAKGDPYLLAARVIAAVAALVGGVAAVSSAMKESDASYAAGGYTGDGGKFEPAGTVHKGEYVLPQDTVRKYGKERLEALHYGRIPVEQLTGSLLSVNYAGMLQTHQQAKTIASYDMRRLENKFDLLLEAYSSNGGTQLTIDENGFVAIYNQHVKNKTRIDKLR